tara:strand:+ start:989 stop:1252 length:264 start_codon:yes stop_codon:yes gene_type:complete
MTYREFVQKIADNTGHSQEDVKRIIASATDGIVSLSREGERVRLPGLGTFSKRHRKARMGRNPQNGQTIPIPARDTLVFKVSSSVSL